MVLVCGRGWPAVLWFAPVALLGCSAPVALDVADAAAGGSTHALVVVERATSTEGLSEDSVSARFMRVSPGGDVQLAERVVGARLEVPPVGECVDVTGEEELSSQSRPTIELLDAGDVALRASGGDLALSTRAFPDVGELVSGVFYTSREALGELEEGTVGIDGSGSAHVDAFSVEVDAPASLRDVRVGGAALDDGFRPLVQVGAPLLLTWSPGLRGEPGDRIVVDVSGRGGSMVRCAFADRGEATVPAASIDGVIAASASPTIAVHRVRTQPVDAPGLESGEVRFDLSVSGRAVVTTTGESDAP